MDMTSGSPSCQNTAFSYQNGVWLSKSEGLRCEKYHKWTEDQIKSQAQRLERQKHNNMVKLNGQCLQVRTELRGLRHERRHFSRHQRLSDSADSLSSASFSSSSSTSASGLRKSQSSHSLTSTSSGYSSPSSPGLAMKTGSWLEQDKAGDGVQNIKGKVAMRSAGLLSLDPNLSALRLKNLHSARSISKLNNDMDIGQ